MGHWLLLKRSNSRKGKFGVSISFPNLQESPPSHTSRFELLHGRSSLYKGDKMPNRKRFFLLSGSFLLMASLVFTFNFAHVPNASAAYSEACPPTQNPGSNNEWVRVIQLRLDALDNNDVFFFPQYPLIADGDFGTNTTNAVHEYQTQFMGIGAGGVGGRTWASLGFCTGFPRQIPSGYTYGCSTSWPATLSSGSSGPWVQALQQMLNTDGDVQWISRGSWWPLALDGSFGTNTENAVKSLQKANNLTQDGKVGPKTWQAMGECH
jgi:peptidoglycan hydrolase-like protein with peptidoglycan-binding domain